MYPATRITQKQQPYLVFGQLVNEGLPMDQKTEEEVQSEKRAARLQRYAVAGVVAVLLVLWSYDIWFPATQP